MGSKGFSLGGGGRATVDISRGGKKNCFSGMGVVKFQFINSKLKGKLFLLKYDRKMSYFKIRHNFPTSMPYEVNTYACRLTCGRVRCSELSDFCSILFVYKWLVMNESTAKTVGNCVSRAEVGVWLKNDSFFSTAQTIFVLNVGTALLATLCCLGLWL